MNLLRKKIYLPKMSSEKDIYLCMCNACGTYEEEAMNIVSKHMRKMRIEKKKEINELFSQHLFPRQGQKWTDVK